MESPNGRRGNFAKVDGQNPLKNPENKLRITMCKIYKLLSYCT